MDSLVFAVVIILLILFAAIFIFPIVIISKINSLGNELRNITSKINSLESEIRYKGIRTVEATKTQPKEERPEYMPQMPKVPEIIDTPAVETHAEPKPAAMESPSPEIVIKSEQKVEQENSIVPPPIPKPKVKDERNIFEKLLGTNWLSKVGVVTLVLGIGFFVKYAIDQNWINEVGRVGVGILTGGIIIGIARKLKTKYHVFSSILAGGGISVFYITITLAFREYALFGQTPAFVFLILITVFSVILSLLYNRKELAVFSLLGGFASPLMVSTGVGNYIVLFSYIFILNAGMLIVSFIKKWRIIGIISFVLTLSFFWVWTLHFYDNRFFNVSLFISLFFIQFYLLALFDHYKSGKKLSAYQVFLILTNNLSAFLAYIYVFNAYSPDIRGLITISLAVINAVVLVVLFKNSRIDRNMIYLIIALVLSFVSLAIPVQLKGHVITLFWAAETVILLWLWQKSRIRIFYLGFMLISLLVLISYVMDIHHLYSYNNMTPVILNRLFITGIVVIAAFAVNTRLLKRESMETNSNKRFFRIFSLIIILLAFVVPVIEIDMQLAHYANIEDYAMSSFRFTALATFTTIYFAVFGIVYSKKISTNQFIFGLLYFAILLYSIFYTDFVTALRGNTFSYATIYPAIYFSVHLLALPAIACIVYLVVKNIKSLPEKTSVWLSWLLTVLVVVIVSVETDNIVVWILGNPQNYDSVLHDVHSYGYPILWGVIAMILMIWGLNRKEALLRKISLVFFLLIVVKFYAYDVWRMPQSGRIISFVLLGVILLLVSFLQQKIRTLVKDDEEKKNENNEISQ